MKTKITLHEDKPTAISSQAYNANLDTIGFNITYLMAKNPKLVKDIMRIYAVAKDA